MRITSNTTAGRISGACSKILNCGREADARNSFMMMVGVAPMRVIMPPIMVPMPSGRIRRLGDIFVLRLAPITAGRSTAAVPMLTMMAESAAAVLMTMAMRTASFPLASPTSLSPSQPHRFASAPRRL